MAILDTKDDIKDGFETAKKHMKPYFDPLSEFERLARNKPHENVVRARLPTVTDGTLAAVVQAQPRRIIQQLPTGRVISTSDPDLALLADFIWTNGILVNANTSGDPLQKCWIASTKAKTYGSQPTYQFFNAKGEYYGADFMLPYIKDVFPEPGKLNANDSEYIFMQSWWTKGQVKMLIEREKRLRKSAKERMEPYDSTWNLAGLSEVLDHLSPKDPQAKSPTESEKDTDTQYARIVHAFQVGVGANFYAYAPQIDKVIRTKKNPDPRGCLPISYLYDTIDLSNPLGRGVVELTGGMQNLIDSRVQSQQFMQSLMQAPPLKKWGTNISNSTIKYKPNAVWDMGASREAADIEVVRIETAALNNFANEYGLMKSQILNLTNNQDTSISAEVGNPGFSKTDAGVDAQESRIAVDDNYFRKQFETWFEQVAETMLNIHFAESTGTREIELTNDFLKKVPAGSMNDYFSVSPEGDRATILYDAIKTKMKFEVDASTTQVKDDGEQRDRNLQLLELAMAHPELIKVDPLIERIVNKSGVDDPQELLYTPEERQQMQEQQAMQEQMAAEMPPEGAPMETMADPQDPRGLQEVPAPPEEQPPIDPEDELVLDQFLKAGFSEEQAMNGLTLMHNGYDTEQIMQILTESQGVAA